MNLNIAQKIVIALGIVVMVVMVLNPPFAEYANGDIGSIVTRVDAARLAIQEIVVLLATCGVVLIFKDSSR